MARNVLFIKNILARFLRLLSLGFSFVFSFKKTWSSLLELMEIALVESEAFLSSNKALGIENNSIFFFFFQTEHTVCVAVVNLLAV